MTTAATANAVAMTRMIIAPAAETVEVWSPARARLQMQRCNDIEYLLSVCSASGWRSSSTLKERALMAVTRRSPLYDVTKAITGAGGVLRWEKRAARPEAALRYAAHPLQMRTNRRQSRASGWLGGDRAVSMRLRSLPQAAALSTPRKWSAVLCFSLCEPGSAVLARLERVLPGAPAAIKLQRCMR